MSSTDDDDRDPQAQRLEEMKREFRVAQQRRRQRAPEAASRPDDADDGPPLESPGADGLSGVADWRP